MENNRLHIDDFLFLQLSQLEQLPDDMAFGQLIHEMDKLHPIDYVLNEKLNDTDSPPNAESEQMLFAALANNEHPIDAALNQSLSNLEAIPEKQWQEIAPVIVPAKDQRRRVLWLFFLGLTIATTVYLFKDNDKGTITKASTLRESSSTENANNKVTNDNTTLRNKSNEKEIERLDKSDDSKSKSPRLIPLSSQTNEDPIKLTTSKPTRRKYTQGSNHWMFEIDESRNEKIDAQEISSLKHVGLEKTNVLLYPDTISELYSKIFAPPSYLKKRLSPLFFGAGFGFINEHTVNNTISNRNIHKDAVSVFSQATGINRNGYTFNLYAGYRILPNFSFQTGITYSKTSVNSDMDYTFTEIPIFNPDGTIAKYGSRSVANSPKVKEGNKNENTNLLIPIQVSFKFVEINKLSMWIDGGARFLIKNEFSTHLYSFLNAELVGTDHIKQQKVTPTSAVTFKYQLRPDIHLSAQLQLGYQQKIFYLENYYFKKTEITPAFNIGIIYNPLIKQR